MPTPHWPLLAGFALASLVLAATPGPGVLYIVTRTLAQGRRAGLASVAGVACGNLGNAMGASLGLAALLAVSAVAFTVVKFAGASYLIWLGIKALRDAGAGAVGAPAASNTPQDGRRPARIMRDGFVVALLNPKTAIFFAAFLPQFIDPVGSAVAQSALFGAAFVAIAACTDTAYVLAASAVAPLLGGMGRAREAGHYATAAVYLGLGVATAFSHASPSNR